jgi:transcriptional regulatory protein RtcR|tara:strand:- start:861 stop:2453 length:1593 start_codon:yes stop_codon:yes gene_type:complete
MPKTIVVSLLGTQLDFVGKSNDRWQRWRPNVSLCAQQDWVVDELHLIHEPRSQRLASQVAEDITHISPETQVIPHRWETHDPWDFEEMYAQLYDFCQQLTFEEDADYYFHITTGTHVAQICIFLLTESRIFPGKLVQSSPLKGDERFMGQCRFIDLDLSKYDQLASRFAEHHLSGESFLKQGIETQNAQFNTMIEQIEKVAIRSKAPILLTGPTGAGKSQLASRIYQLKKLRDQVSGRFISVNCATLRGDSAMSALFGHVKGAFTGAQSQRDGFLKSADKGTLFLDEIGELGADEQAMLLSAIETKAFYPVGSDSPVSSDFQLIAGTHRNLAQLSQEGRFREDLLARINLWTYALPGLKDRREDIAPNIDYELKAYEKAEGKRVTFNKEAYQHFMHFALSDHAIWQGNFRDLNAAITRMGTLANGARISLEDVKAEIERLNGQWASAKSNNGNIATSRVKDYVNEPEKNIDRFDLPQLDYVLNICSESKSMAAAGRYLFNISRTQKSSCNDSARLGKYLEKYGLRWADFS